MTQAGVVFVGGGLAAHRCAETQRRRGYEKPIRMVCAEPVAPYDRPPLSKKFLAGDEDPAGVSLKPPEWYADNEVELLLGRSAVGLNAGEHRIDLDDGSALEYEKLLIATGAQVRSLPALAGYENVHELRTIADSERLRAEIAGGGHLAVVGAGFIGQEVAATSRALGNEVTIIEAMASPLHHILGPEVGDRLARMHSGEDTNVMPLSMVEGARGNGRVEELCLVGGQRIACDAVVVGIGVMPMTGWLLGSGLEEDGILTDAGARTGLPDVYAAGDVTRSFDPRTGEHSRTEHWDAAVRQGRAAALSMLGETSPPPPLPSFWSDQYGSRIQYVGHAEQADRVEIDGEPGEREFTAVYMRGDYPVAAIATDRPRVISALRREIEESYFARSNTKGTNR